MSDRRGFWRDSRYAWVVLFAALPSTAQSGSFDSFNVDLISHIAMSARDIDADGDLVYVARGGAGASIIDVSDELNPQVLTTWTHPTETMNVQDIRALNGDVWLSNEPQGSSPFGAVGLDLTNPASPTIITELAPPTFPEKVHNMWPYGNLMFLSGYQTSGGNVIVDLTNPSSPSVVANVAVGIHDINVVDDVMYIAGGYDATYLYDVTDPANPTQIVSFTPNTPDSLFYQHNAYPIGNTGYVVVTEEIQQAVAGGGFVQGSVRVWDLNGTPTEVWRWKSEAAETNAFVHPHNAYVIGDYIYLSSYQDGLRIFDVSVPSDPVEVAFLDTFPGLPTAFFQGCWGVDPFQGDSRIFLADTQNGFFQVAFNGAVRATLVAEVRDAVTNDLIPFATAQDVSVQRSFTTDIGGTFTEKSGSGTHEYVVSAPNYEDLNESVALVGNQTTNHVFLLTPTAVATEAVPGVVEFRLRAARPNPFGPRTTLGFDVPSAMAGERAAIRVFDARGQLVRTLLDEAATSGSRDVQWDGRNDAGFRMGSGVYFARMTVGTERVEQRVVLAR